MTISRHTKRGAVELARNVNEQRESDKWAASVALVGLSVSQAAIEATFWRFGVYSLQFETLQLLLCCNLSWALAQRRQKASLKLVGVQCEWDTNNTEVNVDLVWKVTDLKLRKGTKKTKATIDERLHECFKFTWFLEAVVQQVILYFCWLDLEWRFKKMNLRKRSQTRR